MTEITIDAHTHIWDLNVTPQPWIEADAAPALERNFSIDELKVIANQSSVKHAVVIQTVNEVDETEQLLASAESDPFIAGVVGWTDFSSTSSEDNIERLLSLPGGDRLLGFRHVFAAGEVAEWAQASRANAALQFLGQQNLSFDLLLHEQELPLALSLVRQHPEVTFVLDHLAKPVVRSGATEQWREKIAVFAQAPNVYAKFSGLPYEADWHDWSAATLAPYFEIALQSFTAERLIFATDWPVCTVAGSYDKIVDEQLKLCQDLSTQEVAMVLGGNAQKAYRIEVHSLGNDV